MRKMKILLVIAWMLGSVGCDGSSDYTGLWPLARTVSVCIQSGDGYCQVYADEEQYWDWKKREWVFKADLIR